ncbi:MAG: hypothetical protein CMJ48_13195 [Planctomycetaceae bacterium]|nr:hypothetical protein [Planctomycetaceae bacterium]
MNIPCPAAEELSGYSLGILADDRSLLIDDHLEECGECQAAMETLAPAPDTLMEQLASPKHPDPYEAEPECRQLVASVAGGVYESFDRTSLVTGDGTNDAEADIPDDIGV